VSAQAEGTKLNPIWPMKSVDLKDLSEIQHLLDDGTVFGEVKYDGRRGIATKDAVDGVNLYSSSLKCQTGKLPHVEGVLEFLADGTMLDFEYVVFKDGKQDWIGDYLIHIPNFTYTAKMMGCKSRSAVAHREQEFDAKVSIVIFDIPFYKGEDLRGKPWSHRRLILEGLLVDEEGRWGTEHVQISPLITPNPENLTKLAEMDAEGIMLKHRDGLYLEGDRKWDTWWKHKFRMDHDVVITGFNRARDGSKYEGRAIGSVRYGQYRDGQLVERGQFAGMDDGLREQMYRFPDVFIGKVVTINAFDPVPGKEGLRMPQFKEFRDDKRPLECTWDN
jgi:ATP-dependent DNA ligase